jgi:L-amino acid N-acyltransferase YncA
VTEPGSSDDGTEVLRRATLKNGLRVEIRPLRHEDRDEIAHGFEGLSERSRYLRFLTLKGELSEKGLENLVDRVDQHDHVAVALWWPRRSTDDVLLGEGRFIRLRSDPETADVAVTVADEIQGQGAGTLIMDVLAERAREEGVRRFTAVMSGENEPSHRMMMRAGRVVRDELSEGTREIDVELPGQGPA